VDDKVALVKDDRVIFTGDLIDRGPSNDGCIVLARRIEQRQGSASCVLGNHEEKHLSYINNRHYDESWMPPTHVATRKQLKPEHYDWMRRLPLTIRLPEHNAVIVHAGVFPG